MTRTAPNYAVGDIVSGNFSCQLPPKRMIRVVVTGRYVETNGRPGFIGRELDPPPHVGWGAWGYDFEIVKVERAGDATDDRTIYEYRLSWDILVPGAREWRHTERIAKSDDPFFDIEDQYATLALWSSETSEEQIRNVVLERRPAQVGGWERV